MRLPGAGTTTHRLRACGGGRVGGLAAGALLAVSVAVSGCTTTRSDLGTSDSSCYLALPTAAEAVHARGHMVGVHRDTLATLRRLAPGLYRQLDSTNHLSEVVCVVAFTGHFTKASVSDPHGRPRVGWPSSSRRRRATTSWGR